MIIITGDTRSVEFVEKLKELGWGRMFIDKKIKPYKEEPWGFDNGAFRDWKKGKNFAENRYLKAVNNALYIAKNYHYPYLSVLPDMVAKGKFSLEFSSLWYSKLKKILKEDFDDFNWYLALQDGMSVKDVEEFILNHKIKGLFLGGTDKFKIQAPLWSDLAKSYNLKFHFARAGTPKKYSFAKICKADSIDSAFPLWIKERLDLFIHKGEELYNKNKSQLSLFNQKY